MSHSRLPFRRKHPFLFRKTEPRKLMSRSPLKFTAEENARELGPIYQTIDIRIGNQRMILDITQGVWIPDKPDEIEIDSQDLILLEQRKRELEEDNSMFHAKLDLLLEMLAQVTAEEELEEIEELEGIEELEETEELEEAD